MPNEALLTTGKRDMVRSAYTSGHANESYQRWCSQSRPPAMIATRKGHWLSSKTKSSRYSESIVSHACSKRQHRFVVTHDIERICDPKSDKIPSTPLSTLRVRLPLHQHAVQFRRILQRQTRFQINIRQHQLSIR